MTNKKPNKPATPSTGKPKITLAAGVTQSPKDATIDSTRDNLLVDGFDEEQDELELITELYEIADHVAAEVFSGITDSGTCKSINCKYFQGDITSSPKDGFLCDVYEKEMAPSFCPVTQVRMKKMSDALLTWQEDFGVLDLETSTTDK